MPQVVLWGVPDDLAGFIKFPAALVGEPEPVSVLAGDGRKSWWCDRLRRALRGVYLPHPP